MLWCWVGAHSHVQTRALTRVCTPGWVHAQGAGMLLQALRAWEALWAAAHPACSPAWAGTPPIPFLEWGKGRKGLEDGCVAGSVG